VGQGQRVSILAQAVGRLLVFQRVALDEGVERQLGGESQSLRLLPLQA
jgi:hypothetical protein